MDQIFLQSTIEPNIIQLHTFIINLIDLRIFSTVFSFLTALYILARSYAPYEKRNEKGAIINIKTQRGLLYGPIAILFLKYTLIVYAWASPNLFNNFSSNLLIPTNFYIFLFILDIFSTLVFLVVNCIGKIERPVLNTAPFLFLFILRILMSLNIVDYYFSHYVFDIICLSFLVTIVISEREKVGNFLSAGLRNLKAFYLYLKAKISSLATAIAL